MCPQCGECNTGVVGKKVVQAKDGASEPARDSSAAGLRSWGAATVLACGAAGLWQ